MLARRERRGGVCGARRRPARYGRWNDLAGYSKRRDNCPHTGLQSDRLLAGQAISDCRITGLVLKGSESGL